MILSILPISSILSYLCPARDDQGMGVNMYPVFLNRPYGSFFHIIIVCFEVEESWLVSLLNSIFANPSNRYKVGQGS